jgi:anti-sigma factor RsiW
MNQDLALKFQAFVDGELREAEARQVAQLLETDADARALVAELRDTKALLVGNEPHVALPETREFYWSKIAREIERLEAEPSTAERSGGWLVALAGWRRFLAPLAGVAVITFLAMVAVRFYSPEPVDYLAEIENLSDESTAYSFRAGNMFVVWTKDTAVASDDSSINYIDYNDAVAQ